MISTRQADKFIRTGEIVQIMGDSGEAFPVVFTERDRSYVTVCEGGSGRGKYHRDDITLFVKA